MKTYIKTFTFLLTLMIFFTACTEDMVGKVDLGTIRGKVVISGSNEPLTNVKVTTKPSSQTVFTDSDGSFILEEVPSGSYSVKAELKGYLTTFESVSIQQSEQKVNVVIEMNDDESLNSPPSVPQLLSPTDDSKNQPQSVTLTWLATDSDSTDVLTYKLIVKNDLNNEVIKRDDIKQNTYTLENLSFGTTYYWQVSVNDGIHEPVNSDVYRFRVNDNPNNRYHYVKKINGNYVIISSNEDGESFQFTPTANNSFRPRLNQNAGLIAFLRTTGGNSHIFTANRNGTNAFQVTQVPVNGFNNAELDFSWNQNGSSLIYPNFTHLYRINKDGSGQEIIYTTSDGSFVSECDWSADGSKIALKTNDANGYNVKIIVIDMLGNVLHTVLDNVSGGAGGLNFSVDGNKLLYCYDISGHEDNNYRKLNSHLFIADLVHDTATDLSTNKDNGTNDLDPRFSPNDASVIFVNTSNDGISTKKIQSIEIETTQRAVLFSIGEMPDSE